MSSGEELIGVVDSAWGLDLDAGLELPSGLFAIFIYIFSNYQSGK